MAWWRKGENGHAIDPYTFLGENYDDDDKDETGVSGGGAAAYAYLRLHSGHLSTKQIQTLKSSLLRYCELDTLAMVMIVQAWQNFLYAKEDISE